MMRTILVFSLLTIQLQVFATCFFCDSPGGIAYLFFNSGFGLKHPVHLTYTNVEFNQSASRFEIMIKLFADDFNSIIQKKYGKDLKLVDGNPVKDANTFIDKYILEHFRLIIDGKDKTKSDLKFVKMEFKELSVWLYYTYSFKGNVNIFSINNSLMTDLYSDQTNLLIFTFKNEQKAIRFSNQKTNEKLNFH